MADTPHHPPAKPIDVVDGIPYRLSRRPWWKYLLVAVAFLAWVGVLGLLYWLGKR
jgi:hypothetical protein